MRDFLAVTKALADETRVRALLALAGGELCVCQLIQLLALAPSTVSRHMAVLHRARLVESRKDGRWVYYRLPDKPRPPARQALRWALRALRDDERVRTDARAVRAVRKMSRGRLCARYSRG